MFLLCSYPFTLKYFCSAHILFFQLALAMELDIFGWYRQTIITSLLWFCATIYNTIYLGFVLFCLGVFLFGWVLGWFSWLVLFRGGGGVLLVCGFFCPLEFCTVCLIAFWIWCSALFFVFRPSLFFFLPRNFKVIRKPNRVKLIDMLQSSWNFDASNVQWNAKY